MLTLGVLDKEKITFISRSWIQLVPGSHESDYAKLNFLLAL